VRSHSVAIAYTSDRMCRNVLNRTGISFYTYQHDRHLRGTEGTRKRQSVLTRDRSKEEKFLEDSTQ
jgi:hypothetical protein